MQVSAEVRWFIAGRVPDSVEDWFRRAPFVPGGGTERTDVYVLDKSTAELGIKARGNKPGLEIKSLIDAAASRVIVDGAPVPVQLWTKTVSRTLSLAGLPTVITKKTRLLRKFDTANGAVHEVQLGGGEQKEEPLAGERPVVGCNVELTDIRVGDLRWTSFGVEAFAFVESDAMAAMVDGVKRAVEALQKSGVPDLAGWTLDSYPSWLMRLA